MAQVATGAGTWVPHTHRHHHCGGTNWIYGPDDPSNVSGPDPQIAPAEIGSYEFIFWAASGTTSGGDDDHVAASTSSTIVTGPSFTISSSM